MSFPTDLEIAESATLLHIKKIAEKIGIAEDDLEYYGKYKAKIPLHYIDEEKVKSAKLVLVTAINPTPAGEGKTTVSVGLNDGLNKIGKKSIAVLREPSLGPVFGMKGGAAGGGYAQLIPMIDINLHFTGDFSAIEKANNLLSALIDNNLQNKKFSLNLDPRTITWKRVMDMNDRSLRNIVIGLGGPTNGITREDGFNITPASEVMAIICLSTDFEDLKKRLGNIFVGYTFERKPIFARDLKAENAMAILLRDAIKPNLVQTLEGNPAILHGGPFANIAQGTNSIIATKAGLSLADYVVTEAGFGADLGAEKFLHIKCYYGKIKPDAYVIVATVRALRYHGGATKAEYQVPNLPFLEKGFENLAKHIENAFKLGMHPIVAINRFANDAEEEINFIKAQCEKLNVKAILAEEFTKGGAGMTELAEEVVRSAESMTNNFKPLYQVDDSVENKIETIAREIYGAESVVYSQKAKNQLKTIYELGIDKVPICMAKTQKSLSDDDTKIGRPVDFKITVREFEFASGAGFLIPILGDVMRMPGLPNVPSAEGMHIDKNGKITGLS
ncbi:formate--tetrahydrofolate ligase [Chryseobacterium sp. MP_3.2]|uniref:formate--tetrahydrofolate ligase n=1 Tax=Chryseobacterium sp. MP_3.2 TaxID=3071712 RepID=UPI002DFF6030|nr:formate--tetrahydrofolate ligase [Chryseobacterium sp. MP_3.2]